MASLMTEENFDCARITYVQGNVERTAILFKINREYKMYSPK